MTDPDTALEAIVMMLGAIGALGLMAAIAAGGLALADRLIPARNPGYACVCGCDPDTHEHYRPGDDCGACGPEWCPSYAPDRAAPVPALPGARR